LDFSELQKTGRIGRIELTSTSQGNKTIGKILIPTNLDRFMTALIAAMVESIDRVGPYHARVTIEKIEDTRAEKKRKIIERARAILYEWEKAKIPEDDEVLKELEEAVIRSKVVEFGPDRLPAGPDVESCNELIIVEGRADVINLLRHGYRNVVAVEGVKVPKSISELTRRKKTVIAFLDGDRGGDLILRELLQNSKIDFVARAPYGKEVEELTGKEISEALQRAVTVEEVIKNIKHWTAEKSAQIPEGLAEFVKEVDGNLMAIILDETFQVLAKMPVSELAQRMPEYKNMKYVVFDGVVTQRLVDIATTLDHDVYLIGMRVGEISKRSPNVHIISADQLINN
jgi:DNA primase